MGQFSNNIFLLRSNKNIKHSKVNELIKRFEILKLEKYSCQEIKVLVYLLYISKSKLIRNVQNALSGLESFNNASFYHKSKECKRRQRKLPFVYHYIHNKVMTIKCIMACYVNVKKHTFLFFL